MKKTLFIKNALILTVSSLILRFVGIIFKVWLAKLIGSEGIGLYQLVFSVYMLASTFAASGICTAVTRLIAEELAVGTKKG
ncbi:MAG: oligosaccharide flippase family protein, partial [Acutalibacteraceae bacterium]|nr:oligosaccharide flippase family protein [Acutalibacteraceae bacterium]